MTDCSPRPDSIQTLFLCISNFEIMISEIFVNSFIGYLLQNQTYKIANWWLALIFMKIKFVIDITYCLLYTLKNDWFLFLAKFWQCDLKIL